MKESDKEKLEFGKKAVSLSHRLHPKWELRLKWYHRTGHWTTIIKSTKDHLIIMKEGKNNYGWLMLNSKEGVLGSGNTKTLNEAKRIVKTHETERMMLKKRLECEVR